MLNDSSSCKSNSSDFFDRNETGAPRRNLTKKSRVSGGPVKMRTRESTAEQKRGSIH